MSIRLLSRDIIEQINSSVEITDINVVICELFKNSLDANATRVELSVDYNQRACIVEDNGFGILPSEFGKNGGLGKLNHSSKPIFHSDHHGGKGTFLASLSNVSLLKITSRHRLYRSSNTMILQHSNVLSRLIPAPLWEHISFDHGTKVTVNDLFGGMPVRIKHCTEKMSRWQKDDKEWALLVNELVKLVFAWRDNVEVIMRNPLSHKKLIIRYPNSSASTADPGLKVCSILRQVPLNTVEDTKSWVTVQASNSYANILGTISLLPCATKKYQFISFGIRPLNEKKHLLFDLINFQFSHSDFGVASKALEPHHDSVEKYREDETYQSFGRKLKEPNKSKKCIDRWPKFYLKFMLHGLGEELKTSTDGNTGGEDYDGTSNMVTGLLQKMIEDFLLHNNFRPNTNNSCHPSMSKHSRSRETLVEVENLGETVSNLVPKSTLTRIQKCHKTPPGIRTTENTCLPTQGFEDSYLLTGPIPKIKSRAAVSGAIQNSNFSLDTRNIAKNNTKRMTIKKKETHNLAFDSPSVNNLPYKVPESVKHSLEPLQKGATNTVVCSFPEISRLGRTQTEKSENFGISTTCVDSYEKKSLKVDHCTGITTASRGPKLSRPNKNPKLRTTGVIARPEHKIPRNLMPLDKQKDPIRSTVEKQQFQVPTNTNPIVQNLNCDQNSNFFHSESYPNLTGLAILDCCIYKDDLRNAEIIAQVDKKFILVRLNQIQSKTKRNKESILVMVDQHAADERIRIESLLKELCVPEKASSSEFVNRVSSHALKTPIKFELLLDELNILSLFKAHFIRWGILFEICSEALVSHENTNHGNVTIVSLPPTIVNRCTRQPHLLLELIRLEIKKLHEHSPYDLIEPHNLENTCWYDQVHTCPDGILELLTSRACRSAVMFNDELSREASETLVRELASCKYPFQCAHGRPSLVPLLAFTSLNFSSQITQVSDKKNSPRGQGKTNFIDKFLAWKNLQIN